MDPGLVLDIAVKIAVVAFAVYPVARPESSHFQGKAMGVRAWLYPLATLIIPAIWLLSGRPGPYPYLADIALGLPFLVDAAANVFGLFAIRRFDAIPHASGWCFLAVAFGLGVAPLVTERWIAFGLVLGFGAVVDILWEIGEFAMLRSGASGLQLTYENTIQDLAMSLGGAAVGALLIVTVLWPSSTTSPTPFGWT